MAKRKRFADESMDRIARVVRYIEGSPRSTPGQSSGYNLTSNSEVWIECKNAASETIPAYSVVFLDNNVPTLNDRNVSSAIKPSTTFYNLHGFTMPLDAEYFNGNGNLSVTMEVALVKYDSGTPLPGEGWGIKPGQYTLSKGYPGGQCIRVVDATNKIMLARYLPIHHFLGKTEVSVSAGASLSGAVAGAYKIYGGTKGSEVDGGWTTVPAVWFRVSLDAGVWFRASWLNDGWEGEPLACE